VSTRDARSRFGGALVFYKSYDRHGYAPDDRSGQSFDEEDLRKAGLIHASAGCHDGECHSLQETAAYRAGQQSRQTMSDPPKSILMERHRREMSADETANDLEDQN
jgi:hypothetical protein